MITVPVTAIPSQAFSIVLALQKCQIAIYQKGQYLFFDLSINGSPIVTTRMCQNRIRLLLDAQYYGFVGDFVFVDTQGDTPPAYTGLGDRYKLLYLEASDLNGN